MKLVTLSPSDPEFNEYLDGELLSGQRAVALNSLNDGKVRTRVTFKTQEPLSFKSQMKYLIKTFRVRQWPQVLTPLLVLISFFQLNDLNWRADISLVVLIGILFGYSAANMLGDYLDYRQGWDSVRSQAYSALTQGRLTSKSIKSVILFFAVVCIVCAIVLVTALDSLFFAVLMVASLLVYFWTQKPFRFKYRMGGEWVVFFLLGPLLSIGYSVAIVGKASTESFLIGVSFGALVLFQHLLLQFKQIMTASRCRHRSIMVSLGFDGAKKYVLGVWSLVGASTLIYQFAYIGWDWLVVFFAYIVFAGFKLYIKLKYVESPLGGRTRNFIHLANNLSIGLYFIWVSQSLWFFVLSGLFNAN